MAEQPASILSDQVQDIGVAEQVDQSGRHLQPLPDNPTLTVEEWSAWWESYIPHVGGKPLSSEEDLKWWGGLPQWRKDLYRIPQGISQEERSEWLCALGLDRVVSYAVGSVTMSAFTTEHIAEAV